MGNDGSLTFDTKILTDGFSAGVNKLGSIAKTGLAVLGSAVVGGVTAFGALTKASLDSVASLEQNIGGVETLFKKSADTVIANAKKAYETAGLSANDYMSTVTSFSASLLQSLGGDTKKAADYADRAIVDMSDNANKMGTSMESIQNAYQGFAKQNYTMLDNLKLGYGGTKEEMKRLVKDASKMTDVQKELGVTVDESSLSFGNIVNAISVMQKSMGIAGTTAEEAATTIEGSMNSAKAALDNFMNGTISAEDFAKTINVAAENIVKNLEEIVPRLVQTIPIAAGAIFDQVTASMQEHSADMIQSGSQLLSDFVTGIAQSAPSVIDAAANIVDSFISNIGNNTPHLANSGMQIAESLVSGILRIGGSLVSAGAELLENFASGLSESAPQLTERASDIIVSLISGIQSYAPKFISSAATLIRSFAQGLASNLPQLIQKALLMVVTLADSIISNIPVIVDAGINILEGLARGIIVSLPLLISEGPRIINDFANAIYSGLWELIKAGLEMIISLAKGLWDNRGLLLENAGEIFMAVINIFSLSKLLSLGKSLMTNLGNGIKSMFDSIRSAGSNVLKNLVDGIKSLATHPVSTIKGILTNVKNAITGVSWSSLGGKIISYLVDGIRALALHPVATVKDIVSGIKHVFSGTSWSSIGSNIISGIINGLKAGAGAIVNAAKNVAKSALDAAKNFLGIKSPSRRFRDEVGKMMALGIGIGFEDNIPDEQIDRSLKRTLDHAKNRMNHVTSGSFGIKDTVYSSSSDSSNNGNTYVNQTVNIHQPVKSPVETARALRKAGRELAYA